MSDIIRRARKSQADRATQFRDAIPQQEPARMTDEYRALSDLENTQASTPPHPDLLSWADKRVDRKYNGMTKAIARAVPTPRTEEGKSYKRLQDLENARVDQAPSPQDLASAEARRRVSAPRASEQDPSLSPEGRQNAAFDARQQQRSAELNGRSISPSEFGPLAGRKGVADNTPLEQLTPDQRAKIEYSPYGKGVPRLPRSGQHVWDQRLNDGAGGYADRAPDPQAVKGLGFNPSLQDRARVLGIDHSAYGPESQAQLEADVAAAEERYERRAKNFDAQAIPGGGHRWVPNKYTKAENDRQRAEKFLEKQWSKWQREARADNNGDGKPDMTFQDFKQAYYGSDGNGGMVKIDGNQQESHLQRVRRLRDMITNDLSAERAANTRGAIENRARQDNMARRLGVHPGHIVMHDDLMNARTPEDLIRTLIAHHSINPEKGLGNFAALVQRGIDDTSVAQLQADALSGKNRSPFDRAMDAAQSIGRLTRPEDLQQWVVHAKQMNPNATPEEQASWAVNNTATQAREALSRIADPANKEILRAWTQMFINANPGDGRGDYTAWLTRLGVENNPLMRQVWKELTGQNVRHLDEWAWELFNRKGPADFSLPSIPGMGPGPASYAGPGRTGIVPGPAGAAPDPREELERWLKRSGDPRMPTGPVARPPFSR